ncbi:MAG TPA: hypothetical protein VK927_03495, partial [Adhaeribacter sp.]|nr:hypothetical protein [Adhaeribacter sp.]
IAFRQQWQQVVPLVLAGFTTGLGVLLLYLPLLLVSGPEALLGNKYVQPLTPEQFTEKLPLFLSETQGELLGGKYGAGILVFYISTAVLALLFLFRNLPFLRKYLPKQTTWLIGFVLITSLVVYGLLRLQLVLPPPRVLFFKSFFDLLVLAVLIGMLAKILFRKALLRTLALLAGVLVFAFYQQREAGFFLTDYPEPYYTYPPLNRQIRESGAAKVYVEEPFYRLFLQYDYARFRMPLQLDAGNVYRSRQYDFIVLRKEAPFPAGIPESGYRQVYEDALVKAFRPVMQPNLPEKQ